MAQPSNSRILFRLARGRRLAAAPDPADVGTAYGMELTLAPDPTEDDAASRAPTRRRSPWLRRWVARRP